jgi:hypothetical protein
MHRDSQEGRRTGFAPIVVSVYDRLTHLKSCVESLSACDDAAKSILHVYSDAPARDEHAGRIAEVRSYIGTVEGFRCVIPHFRSANMGAHGSISSALEEVFSESDRLIFLEDDIVVSPHFLRYMNECLEHFRDDPRILAICAYTLPFRMPKWYRKDVFLGRRYSPWGVGLWKHKWEEIDFSWRDRYRELLNDRSLMRRSKDVGGDYVLLVEADSQKRMEAMDVRVCHHQISRGQFCVFPRKSLSTNIGFDGSGMHCFETQRFDAELDTRSSYSIRLPQRLRESLVIRARYRDFQDGKAGFTERLRRKARHAVQLLRNHEGTH